MLFGGYDGSNLQDTWELNNGIDAVPGQMVEILFSAAEETTMLSMKSITTTIHAGGVGHPSGTTVNGVNLQVWDEGRWKVVATNDSPPDKPGLVTWTTSDPAVIPRLFFGDQKTLNFAVTPVAPNGTGTGQIATDYAEVVVRYRQE